MAPKRRRQHESDPPDEHRRPAPRLSPVAGPSSSNAAPQRPASPRVVVPRPRTEHRVQNIHPIGRDGEVALCQDDACLKCSDFEFLASRAQREFGCILVRPDVTAAQRRVDNDDNDPTQPTYRQDNAAFDMICQLEEEKGALQQEIERLHKRQQEDQEQKSRMQAEIGRLKRHEKEITALKRQVTASKKQISELKCQSVGARTIEQENVQLRENLEDLRKKSRDFEQSVQKADKKAARKAARRKTNEAAQKEAVQLFADARSRQQGHDASEREGSMSPLDEEPFHGEPFDHCSFHAATLQTPTPPEPGKANSVHGRWSAPSPRRGKIETTSPADSIRERCPGAISTGYDKAFGHVKDEPPKM